MQKQKVLLSRKIMHISKEMSKAIKKRKTNKNNNASSNKKKIIIIYRKKNRVTLSLNSLNELLNILKSIYFPFYYKNNKIYYLLSNESIQEFWNEYNYKIIYESRQIINITEKDFLMCHVSLDRNKIEHFSDFCSYPECHLMIGKRFYYCKNYWLGKIIKKYRIGLNPKIINLYGPQKSGKTVFIYSFFSTTKRIQYKETINVPNINANDLLNENNNIIIENYNDIIQLEDKLAVDSNLTNLPSFQNNSIDKKNVNKENKNIEELDLDNLFINEFYNGKDNESQYFISSVYIDLLLFQNLNEDNLFLLHEEIQGLFKSYECFQFFEVYLYNEKDNIKTIWNILKLIVHFMGKYNDKRDYVIILDHIPFNCKKELIIFEEYIKKKKNCYLLKIPNVDSNEEKLECLSNLNGTIKEQHPEDNLIVIKNNENEYTINVFNSFYTPKEIYNETYKIFDKHILSVLYHEEENDEKKKDYLNEIRNDIIEQFENCFENKNTLSLYLTALIDYEENEKCFSKENLVKYPIGLFNIYPIGSNYKIKFSFPFIKEVLNHFIVNH
jgi:hypothetical protein